MRLTDQAAQVLAEIDAELAICEKATAGPWKMLDDTDDFTGLYVESLGHPLAHQDIILKMEDSDCPEGYNNAIFIASARTVCPKSLRCLKTAIEGLLRNVGYWEGQPNCTSQTEKDLTTLCEQWEASR